MPTIETYGDESTATGARDYHIHQRSRRAIVAPVPNTDVIDYGGGNAQDLFNGDLERTVWIVIVE